eukprot:1429331-Amphidinium_carterae.2
MAWQNPKAVQEMINSYKAMQLVGPQLGINLPFKALLQKAAELKKTKNATAPRELPLPDQRSKLVATAAGDKQQELLEPSMVSMMPSKNVPSRETWRGPPYSRIVWRTWSPLRGRGTGRQPRHGWRWTQRKTANASPSPERGEAGGYAAPLYAASRPSSC